VAYTALLDANVLHPMALCDLLIRLAQYGLYRGRWSRHILAETVDSIQRRRPDISHQSLDRRVQRMNAAVADAEIEGYDGPIPSLAIFGADAHVVAAAIVGRVDVIVTQNVDDFPIDQLRPYHIDVQAPDEFLLAQWGLRPDIVWKAIEEQAAALRNPPMTPTAVVTSLSKSVPRFTDALSIRRHEPKTATTTGTEAPARRRRGKKGAAE
jgi:PIN domain